MKITTTIFAILGLLLLPAMAYGQNQQKKTNNPPQKDTSFALVREQNAKEVATYPLTEAFLTRMEKVRSEFQSLPLEANPSGTGDDDTAIEAMTKAISGRPQLVALLNKYSMSAYDYVVGSMALSAAFSAASAQGEEQFFDESNAVSASNLAFGQKYIDRIRVILND